MLFYFFISLTVHLGPALPLKSLSVYLFDTLYKNALINPDVNPSGRPSGLVLFILLLNKFLINWPFALHAHPNHYSCLLLLTKDGMSGPLCSLFIFLLLLLSYVRVSWLKFGPYLVRKTFFSNVISLLPWSLVNDQISRKRVLLQV